MKLVLQCLLSLSILILKSQSLTLWLCTSWINRARKIFCFFTYLFPWVLFVLSFFLFFSLVQYIFMTQLMFLNSSLASYILMSQRIRYKVDIRGYRACTLSQKWVRRTCHQGLQMFPTDMNACWMLWLQNPKLSWHHLFTAVCDGCTCCSLGVH